jgi:hypothetical protein
MSAYQDEQPSVVVATASTAAAAELAQMTLAAHGIDAVIAARDPAHPSIDFAQGIAVSVRPDDEEDARALLSGAGV